MKIDLLAHLLETASYHLGQYHYATIEVIEANNSEDCDRIAKAAENLRTVAEAAEPIYAAAKAELARKD